MKEYPTTGFGPVPEGDKGAKKTGSAKSRRSVMGFLERLANAPTDSDRPRKVPVHADEESYTEWDLERPEDEDGPEAALTVVARLEKAPEPPKAPHELMMETMTSIIAGAHKDSVRKRVDAGRDRDTERRLSAKEAEEIVMKVAGDVLAGASAELGDAYAVKYDEGDIEEAKLQVALNPEWGEEELRRHLRSRMEAQRDSIANEASKESGEEPVGDKAPEPAEGEQETATGSARNGNGGEPPIERVAAENEGEPPRRKLKDVFSKRAVAEAVLLQGDKLDVNKRGNPKINTANIGAINECVADIEREAAESGRTFEEVAYSRLAPDSHMAAVLRGEADDRFVKFEEETVESVGAPEEQRGKAAQPAVDDEADVQVPEEGSAEVGAEAMEFSSRGGGQEVRLSKEEVARALESLGRSLTEVRQTAEFAEFVPLLPEDDIETLRFKLRVAGYEALWGAGIDTVEPDEAVSTAAEIEHQAIGGAIRKYGKNKKDFHKAYITEYKQAIEMMTGRDDLAAEAGELLERKIGSSDAAEIEADEPESPGEEPDGPVGNEETVGAAPERSPEEIAAENLKLAADVEKLMAEEGLEVDEAEMKAHDPVRAFMRERMGLTDDEINALGIRYRTVTGPEEKEGGVKEAHVTEVETLHDLMAVRGELSAENRAEYDSQTVPEDETGEYVWSRVGIILPREFWNEVLSESGKYHEYEDELLDLLYERIQKDLEPDTYAAAKMEELKARKAEAATETPPAADVRSEEGAREPEAASEEPVEGGVGPEPSSTETFAGETRTDQGGDAEPEGAAASPEPTPAREETGPSADTAAGDAPAIDAEKEAGQNGKAESRVTGDVEGRASQFGIRAEDLNTIEGWDKLSEGQQKLCIENLGQIMLGRIRDEAKVRHSEKVRNEGFLKRLYLGARKQYDLPVLEKGLAKKVMKGGIAMHGELLKQLVRGVEVSGVGAHEEKGRLRIDFAGDLEQQEGLLDEDKKHIRRFNALANELAFSSYEKGVPLDEERLTKRKYTGEGPVDPKNVMSFIHNAGVTADKVIDFLNVGRHFDKREVERQLELRRQYEAERSQILDIRYRTSDKGSESERRFDALEYVNKLESTIELNRFITIEKGATAKIAKIADKAVWRRALAGVATERGLIFASGLALRSFTTSLFGAMGGILFAAPAIGRMSSRMRAQGEMRERDRLARHGEAEPVDLSREEEALAKRSDALEELKLKLEGQMSDDTRRETKAEVASIERQMQNIRRRMAEKRSHLNKDFADATNLGEKLGRLSSSVRQDADAMDRLLAEKEAVKDPADAQRIEAELGAVAARLENNIRKLKARQAFTERKLEEGKVNFGGVRSEERKIDRIDRHIEEIRSQMRATTDTKSRAEMELAVRYYEAKREELKRRLDDFRRNAGAIRLSNQLDLSQSLGFASAVAGLAEGLERSDDDKYRDQRLKERLERADARVAAERAKHMSSSVKRGMLISGGFAAAGYAIQTLVDAYKGSAGGAAQMPAPERSRVDAAPVLERAEAPVANEPAAPVTAEAARPQSEPTRMAEESPAATEKQDGERVVASAAPVSTASVQTGGVRAPAEFKLPVEADRPVPEIRVPDMDEEARERVAATIAANPVGEPQPMPSAEAASASAVDTYRALSERSGELRSEWGRTNARLLDPKLGAEERAEAIERLGELDREISNIEGEMGAARTKALEEIDRKLEAARAATSPAVAESETRSEMPVSVETGEESGEVDGKIAEAALDEGGMPIGDQPVETASAEVPEPTEEIDSPREEPESFFREVADRKPGSPISTGSVQTGSVSTGGIDTSAATSAEAVPDPDARFGPKSIEAFVDKNDSLQLTHYRFLTFLDQAISRYRTPEDIVGVQGNLEAVSRTFDRQPMLFQDLTFKRIAGITRRIEEQYRTNPTSFGDTAKAYLQQMKETLATMEKAQAATKAAFDTELRRFGYTAESYAARVRSNPDMTVKNVLRLQAENKDDKFLSWLVKEFNLRQYPAGSREVHVDTVVSSKFRVLSAAEKQAKSLLAGLRDLRPRRPGP